MNTVLASTATEWRAWLASNHRSATEAWLVLHHKGDLRYPEAIEHALCFGWIDGLHRRRDAHSSQLRFTPRRPRSSWSRLNRERAARMTKLGLMTEHGQAMIDLARSTGTWQVGEVVPEDLRALLDRNETANRNFERFPPSSRRLILEWIATAKRQETRQRRIVRTVELAAENVRANHPRARVRS